MYSLPGKAMVTMVLGDGMMQHVIDKILSEPVMVFFLALAFIASMLGYWARIRRDKKNQDAKKS
jgi:hypothetical protein